jgi:hypothetical protein
MPKRSMPKRSTRAPRGFMAALHEAGHAIVAIAIGWRPTKARIALVGLHGSAAGDRDGELESRGAMLEPRNPKERQLILACMLGGLEAERRRSRRSVLALCAFGGAGGDYNAAVALVASARWRGAGQRAHEPTVDQIADELEGARRVARAIVADHWRATMALAWALFDRKRLSGAEIRRIATQRDSKLRQRHEQARRRARE